MVPVGNSSMVEGMPRENAVDWGRVGGAFGGRIVRTNTSSTEGEHTIGHLGCGSLGERGLVKG